jgi:plastocyanin
VEELLVRSLVISIVAAAVLAVAVGASAAPAKDNFQLKGEVYANALYKIEMKNQAGKKLVTVKAGTYRIKIEDKATIHNFRLRGPGVNKATSVAGKTETVWTVRLRKGTYRFLCDPHAASMRGSFRVT